MLMNYYFCLYLNSCCFIHVFIVSLLIVLIPTTGKNWVPVKSLLQYHLSIYDVSIYSETWQPHIICPFLAFTALSINTCFTNQLNAFVRKEPSVIYKQAPIGISVCVLSERETEYSHNTLTQLKKSLANWRRTAFAALYWSAMLLSHYTNLCNSEQSSCMLPLCDKSRWLQT